MTYREIWQKSRLHVEEGGAVRRPTTWLELFFDLFIVVAVSQLSSQLSSSISWEAVGTFAVQFLAVFWFWVGITFYQERFESEGLENRFFFFFLTACAVGGFLLVVAILEKTPDVRPDEPTDPFWSPLLKLLCAPLALVAGAMCQSSRSLIGALFALLAVQMVYGAWRWFTQKLEVPPAGPGALIAG